MHDVKGLYCKPSIGPHISDSQPSHKTSDLVSTDGAKGTIQSRLT